MTRFTPADAIFARSYGIDLDVPPDPMDDAHAWLDAAWEIRALDAEAEAARLRRHLWGTRAATGLLAIAGLWIWMGGGR